MSKKTKFDSIINANLEKADKSTETAEAKIAFKQFLELPKPELVDAYEWAGIDVLIKIFKFVPTVEAAMQIDTSGATSDVTRTRYFSFARVLAAGPESKYQEGDLVKLKDTETLTIENPQYNAWTNNDYSKSNLKQKGKEPARFGSNIFKTFGSLAFTLNPLDLEALDSFSDDSIYKVSDRNIWNKVLNPLAFV